MDRPTSHYDRRSGLVDSPLDNPNVFSDDYAVSPDESLTPRTLTPEVIPSRSSGSRSTTTLADSPRLSRYGARPRALDVTDEAGRRNSIAKGGERYLTSGFESGPPARGLSPRRAAGQRTESTGSMSTDRSSDAYASRESGVYSSSGGRTSMHRTRTSLGPHVGPNHPYALYQQNVFLEPEESTRYEPSTDTSIPIGFAAQRPAFRRIVGPDGEEQDILGPDGHTEQLPPYSRYADETYAKMAPPGSPPATNAERSTQSLRAAVVANTDAITAASPQPSRHQSMTSELANDLEHQGRAVGPPSSSGSSVVEEKSWSEKTWREKRKTRVCGGRVPIWVLWAFALGIVLIVIIAGSVIAGFMTGKSKEERSRPSATASPTNFGISIISTPTAVPAIERGKYGFPLGVAPESTQRNCLPDSSQLNAWSCEYAGPPITMHFQPLPDTSYPGVSIAPAVFENGQKPLEYGHQAPTIKPQPLRLVVDLDEQARGAAYHFQTTYDKVVLLRERDLSYTNKARSAEPVAEAAGIRPPWARTAVDAGNSLWYCVWNNTFIEAFFYVESNSTIASSVSAIMSSSPVATPAPTPTPTASSSSSSSSSSSPPPPEPSTVIVSFPPPSPALSSSTSSAWSPPPPPPNGVNGNPLATFVPGVISGLSSGLGSIPPLALAAQRFEGPPPSSFPGGVPRNGGYDHWLHVRDDDDDVLAAGAAPSASSAPIPIPAAIPPPFPKVVRLAERRLPSVVGVPGPYCQKVRRVPDGTASFGGIPGIEPMADGDGQPVVVWLNETAPAYGKNKEVRRWGGVITVRDDGAMRAAKRDEPPGSCRCQWLSA